MADETTCPKCAGTGRDGNLGSPAPCWVCWGVGSIDRPRHLTAEEVAMLDRALLASVKIVDEGSLS